jgi:hypothetical protein
LGSVRGSDSAAVEAYVSALALGHIPGLLHAAAVNDVVRDLVERDDGDTALELALLQQQLARLLVVHHHL